MRLIKSSIFLMALLVPSLCFGAANFIPDQSSDIYTNTSNFNSLLSSSETDVQKSLDKLDNLRTSVPTNPTDTCTSGQWAADVDYHYDCILTNTWRRATLDTWAATNYFLLIESGDDLLLETGDKFIME